MEVRLIIERREKCQFCGEKGDAWDNEVTVHGVQVLRFFACIPCKKQLLRLLRQGGES